MDALAESESKGAEMISSIFTDWCAEHVIDIIYNQLGKPNQNGCIERLKRSFRTEILDANQLHSLNQIRELSWAWQINYSEERPQESFGTVTPAESKLLEPATTETASNELCALREVND